LRHFPEHPYSELSLPHPYPTKLGNFVAIGQKRGTFLREQTNIWAVADLPFEAISRNNISYTLRPCPTKSACLVGIGQYWR
jgi:hypothetical protein